MMFLDSLNSFYSQVSESDPLKKVRDDSWELFHRLGLPTKKYEPYRYVPLNKLYSQTCQLPEGKISEVNSLPECSESVLVFVNGSYQPSLSNTKGLPKQMVILPLQEAMRTYGGFIKSQWMQSLKYEQDPFAAVNGALYQDCLFIYVPPKCTVDVPLQILHIVDASAPSMLVQPRIHLFAGAHSQLSCVSTQSALSKHPYCSNLVTEMTLDTNAHVKYIQHSFKRPDGAWHFDALRGLLKRDSSLTCLNVSDGAATTRHDYRISLEGEGAEVDLNGLWYLEGNRQAHNHVLIEHQAPNCQSKQLFKGVLSGSSRSSFEGKILVQQEAQKTLAYQLNNNLLLDDRAQAYSKPNLEIFADDVKASHGATVGKLDDEQIFYMKARGFTDSMAKNLLTQGYCREIVDQIPLMSLRKHFCQALENYCQE